ncbi:MAG: ATP-binding protein [Nanoarchaeota archaeon]
MIGNEDLIRVLKLWNPWEKEISSGIRRDNYIGQIMHMMKRKEIIVLKGIRRSGKSTIMKQIMNELIGSDVKRQQILYLNLEDYQFKDSLDVNLFELALESYLNYSKNKGKIYYFIDEIQNVRGWERYLRTKYDRGDNIKFIITGSNASLLSKELSSLLTGRNITFQVRTLSFPEFRMFSRNGKIDEYLTYGGFPEVVLEKDDVNKKVLLQQYFEDIINKDIISRHSIRNVEMVFNLARYVIENSGRKTSLNKLGKSFGVSDDTISTYLSYMMDSFLIVKVPFFSYSLKKRHSAAAQPKYYATDNGLVNVCSLKFSEDLGKKYENSVFLRIYNLTSDISYWSGENEVDFIYDKKAVNVTSGETIPEREFEGLDEFSKTNKGFKLVLIAKKGSVAKDGIEVLSFEDFMMS